LGRRRSRPEIKRVCQGVFVLVLWTCAEIFSSIYFLFDDVIVTHSIQSYSGIFRENLTSGLKRFGYFRISKSILAYFTFFTVFYKYKSFRCHKLDYFLRTIFVQKVCHTIIWPITQKGLKVIFNTTQSHMYVCAYLCFIHVCTSSISMYIIPPFCFLGHEFWFTDSVLMYTDLWSSYLSLVRKIWTTIQYGVNNTNFWKLLVSFGLILTLENHGFLWTSFSKQLLLRFSTILLVKIIEIYALEGKRIKNGLFSLDRKASS
jgi:hypothetical protein